MAWHRRRKSKNTRRNRRIAFEQCETRALLTVAIELEPQSGQLVSDGGQEVLELQPGASEAFVAQVTGAPAVDAVAFQLNFVESDAGGGELDLSNWAATAANWSTTGTLDPSTGSFLVAGLRQDFSRIRIGSTPVELGAFTVTAPLAGGDYLLTVNGGSGANITAIDNGEGVENVPDVSDYGDIMIRVANIGPVAVADNYAADQLTSLVIDAAQGVLRNDTDVNQDQLSVSLLSDVNSGQLSLNPNGAFTYTPNENFHGSDSFSYRVSDGSATSTATVDIEVEAATPWRNPDDFADVNDDKTAKPQDVLILINFINSNGSSIDLPTVGGQMGSPPPYYDVNGDNRLTVRDVLVAVNELNRRIGAAEGEFVGGSDKVAAKGGDNESAGEFVLLRPVEPIVLPVANDRSEDPAGTADDFAKDVETESLLDLLANDVAWAISGD